jgi:uncharacterized membrane protein YgdD (TMEM256/DUF423 family)
MAWNLWILLGAIWGGLAVAAGAFGAHAMKGQFPPELLQTFDLGARYQMYHALALISIGLLGTRINTIMLDLSGGAIFLGSLIFSGSLYALVLTNQKWWGMVTPVGGISMILGWFMLAYVAYSLRIPS